MQFAPKDFIHPDDQAALEALQAIPLFSTCVSMFMKALPERFLHGLSMAQKIRLGPEQLPELYQHLPPICTTLGIDEPEFYLEMNPAPNAYTYGDAQPILTITSGLVEHLDSEELGAVIAHECGHIVCQHVLYRTMADLLVQFGATVFQPLAAMSVPLRMALLQWYRRSELSADRAAAVIMQGAAPVVQVMIRLAGGPRSVTEKVNIDLYMQQAEAYDKLQESTWDTILQGLAAMGQTHPFLAVRAREIVRWCASPAFAALLRSDQRDPSQPACPGCRRAVQTSWKFCRYCGQRNPHAVTPTTPEDSGCL